MVEVYRYNRPSMSTAWSTATPRFATTSEEEHHDVLAPRKRIALQFLYGINYLHLQKLSTATSASRTSY